MMSDDLLRRSWRFHRTLAALGAAFTFLAFAASAGADAPPLLLGNELQVESAYATIGDKGGSTIVRFRVVNESRVTVVILGVSSSIAENAKLVGRIGASETADLESISVPAGEILDLTTSHLWYELSPLGNKLEAGDVFELTLDLVNARVITDVHVH